MKMNVPTSKNSPLKKSRNVKYFPNTIEKVIFHLNELIGESSWWESVPTIRRNSALRSKKFITSRHTDHDEIQIKIQRQIEIPWKTVQRRRGLEVAARQGEGALGSHHFGRLRWSHFHYCFHYYCFHYYCYYHYQLLQAELNLPSASETQCRLNVPRWNSLIKHKLIFAIFQSWLVW